MSVPCVIGVDVGGTNTDAVVVCGKDILSWSKHLTTADVTTGVVTAIRLALLKCKDSNPLIQQVNIGTTHFVNAVVEQSPELSKVAVIRLATPPCTQAAAPFADFPEDLEKIVNGGWSLVNGGYEYDGQAIGLVDQAQITSVLKQYADKDVNDFVISGVFSPVKNHQEIQVGKLITQNFPSASFTLSHEIGTIGLLERENAAILNQSLKNLCRKTLEGLKTAIDRLSLNCPLYLTQNDGSICSIEMALRFPVFTFASGPTNSMRGAAHISGIDEGIVVDIGGTSTDVGVINRGFPRQAGSEVLIGGVRTNFRMPDTLSIGLGGGSLVKQQNDTVSVGPKSVGYRLTTEAISFGGKTLTATDIAVASGLVPEKSSSIVESSVSKEFVSKSLHIIAGLVENVIDRIKVTPEDVPVILVGGGCVLIDKSKGLKGCSKLTTCEHSFVANAIGAALCNVAGHVDIVKSLDVGDDAARGRAVKQAKDIAVAAAIQSSADPSTVQIVEFEELPLSYLPGNAIQLKGKAVGSLQIDSNKAVSIDWAKLESNVENENNAEGYTQESNSYNDDRLNEVSNRNAPSIDKEAGIWILQPIDVDRITLGAGILGCGGGGNPHSGKVRLLQAMQEGGIPKVLSSQKLEELNSRFNGLIYYGALMGAPLILYERLPAGNESWLAIKALAIFNNGLLREMEPKLKKTVNEEGVTYLSLQEKDLPDVTDQWFQEKVLLTTAEIGGVNSTEPLAVSARTGLPVVDCDMMGRAFPELQMVTPHMYGLSLYPAALASWTGSIHIIVSGPSSKALENCCRMLCIEDGCSSGISMSLKASEVVKYAVPNSISRAWRLGRELLAARMTKLDCVQTAIEAENGKLLGTGKISDVFRSTTGGFNRGNFILEGLGDDAGIQFLVEFQNENLIVKTEAGQVLATTPDLICAMESDTGVAISTDLLRYGLRVSLVLIPPSPLLAAPEGLAVVGPEAFGYPDVSYKTTFATRKEAKSIFEE